MKRNCFVAVLVLALALLSFGRTIKPAQPTEEHKITQLEQQWMDAMKSRDETTLNRLLGSEFNLAGIDDFERPAVPRSTCRQQLPVVNPFCCVLIMMQARRF